MQVSFSSITLDYYPFHKAGTTSYLFNFLPVHVQLKLIKDYVFSGESCVHWMHYSEATKAREGWAKSLLGEFTSSVEMLKTAMKDKQGTSQAQHSSPQPGKLPSLLLNTIRHIWTCCGRAFVLYLLAPAAHRHPCGFSVLQCPLGTMCMGL